MNALTRLKLLFGQLYRKTNAYITDPENMLINWSDFEKGRLLLFFGILSQIEQVKWYLINFYSADTQQWLNNDYFQLRIALLLLCFIVYSFCFWCCFKFKFNQKFQTFISYFSPSFFGITMIYGGYTIGIYSPATMAGFISIVLVGLVFYSRKIIYGIAIPIIISTLLICYLTYTNQIRYAPLFSDLLNNSEIYQNPFWIKSMVQLYVPILLVSILFFEILLTQWRNRERQFENSSKLDALTNVYNRRQINHVIQQYQKQQHNYAVVLLDLDHFKHINDAHGHLVGDEVLKQVAMRLQFAIRVGDTVGRFGGEEFILILDNCPEVQAVEIAERCREAIEKEPIMLEDGTQLFVTASFGVAMANPQISELAITECADQALYAAKENGRNQVCCYPGVQHA